MNLSDTGARSSLLFHDASFWLSVEGYAKDFFGRLAKVFSDDLGNTIRSLREIMEQYLDLRYVGPIVLGRVIKHL